MSPNGSLLAATTSGRPSFSYVRFPGQAAGQRVEVDKEEGPRGRGSLQGSKRREGGQRDQALEQEEGLFAPCTVDRPALARPPPSGQITTQEFRSHVGGAPSGGHLSGLLPCAAYCLLEGRVQLKLVNCIERFNQFKVII